MLEIWKPIPGYGGHYLASSLGRIMTKERLVEKRHRTGKIMVQRYRARILSPSPDKNGYLSVSIGFNNKTMNLRVHRGVLEAFVGPCPSGMECCHGDGNPPNNRVENLRWGTPVENAQDRKMHGNYAAGQDHPMAKLSDDDVRAILADPRSMYKIARDYGVAGTAIFKIKNREIWTHIEGPVVSLPGQQPEDFVRGEAHPCAKLTEADVRSIRQDGRSQAKIGKHYGISQAQVWGIVNRRSWRHVV